MTALRWLLIAGALALAPVTVHAEAVTSDDVVAWTYYYSEVYGADAEDLLRIARCESKLYPYAKGALGEVGPYQWHPRGAWWITPQSQEYSIYDVEAQVAGAAWLYAEGYAYSSLGWWWCSRYGA